MKTKQSLRLAGMLFALFTSVAAVPAASAAPLLTTGTGTLDNELLFWQDAGDGAVYSGQPLSNFRVGSSPVTIGGFGVYGQALSASESSPVLVNWALFEAGAFNTAYWFQQTVTSNAPRWFDSLGVPFQLAANTTYQLGLVTNAETFAWGISQPGTQVSGSGSTLLTSMGTAVVTLASAPGSAYFGIEAIDVDTPYPDFQPALRIWGTDAIGGQLPPVPEPSEWAMLLAGLMVVAFVAKRQRRRII